MTYEEKGYEVMDQTFQMTREQDEFVSRGNVVMKVSDMKQKEVSEKQLMLTKSGKEEERDGTGADHT